MKETTIPEIELTIEALIITCALKKLSIYTVQLSIFWLFLVFYYNCSLVVTREDIMDILTRIL